MNDQFQILKAYIKSLEVRVTALEQQQKQQRRGETANELREVIATKFSRLYGRMTAADVTKALGLPSDHGTMIRISRELDAMGVQRVRSASGRLYVFPENKEAKWLDDAASFVDTQLEGEMTAESILRALELPMSPYALDKIHAALAAKGIEQIDANTWRF